MNAEKKTRVCYGIVLIACMLFFVWLLTGHFHPDDRLMFVNTRALPVEVQEQGNRRIYSATLPAAFEDAQSLMFKSSHAMIEVFIDGEAVYAYGMGERIAGKSPGTYWHVVSLPGESGGKALSMRLTSAYDAVYGADMDVQYGSRGDCILAFVSSFLPILILDCVIITMGLLCLLLCMMAARKREKQEMTGFLCIGLFSLTIAVWSLRQCGFLQFLIPSGEILYYVDLHLLFLVLAPMDLFMCSISHTKWRTGYLWIAAAYMAGVVVTTAMQFAGIRDIFEMLLCLHALIAFNGIYMFFAIYRETAEYENGMVSGMRFPLYTLMLFGVLELVSYYIPMFGGISVFLPLGAMVFILMLIWQQVEGHYQSVLEEQKLLYYEKLANTDLLTGAYNRNAYENALRQFEQAQDGQRGYGAVLFDLNNMKVINDNYGHEKGDEAIRFCHSLILKAFDDRGKCYRIGGDEFVFLASEALDFERCAASFEALVAREKEKLDFPFSVALGYAVFDAARDKSLQDTIKRSDAMMYQDKKRKKTV